MRFFVLLAGVLAVSVAGGVSSAHEGATGVVKERMESMSALGRAAKAIATALRSEESWTPAKVRHAAEVIERHAISLPALFADPATTVAPSAARPEIWQSKATFDTLFDSLADNARALARTAENGDRTAAAAAFRAVGGTCSACHRDFRTKKAH